MNLMRGEQMTSKPLSINEVIRYSNHDFLNHLQLIKMNLDLNRVEQSKQIIEQISEQCKVISNLNKLQLPKTIEWIQTFRWRFPSILFKLESNVTVPQDIQKDEELVECLEKTVLHVYDSLDPFTEQQLIIQIHSNENGFSLTFDLKGKWDAALFEQQQLSNFNVQTYEQSNELWKYVLRI